MGAAPEFVHEMPEAALPGLRPRNGGARAETRGVGGAGEIALAVSGGVTVAGGRGAGVVRRRGNAALTGEKIRQGRWPNESLGERRSAESDAEFQGARDDDSRLDGET